MAATFYDWEIPPEEQPQGGTYAFDLERALSSLVAVTARVPEDAFTAATMGTERRGNGVVISEGGLVVTVGYLIAEADQVWLTTNGGRVVSAHVVEYDPTSGLGLVQAQEPLETPVMALGDSAALTEGDRVVIGAAGGRKRSLAGAVVARHEFAGYWEYVLDDAIFTAPAHPYWGGAALIGPQGTLLGVGSLRLDTRSFAGKVLPINMLIPIELLHPLLAQVKGEAPPRPPRPWLGVFAHEEDEAVVLSGVASQGPASRAGLQQGDVVVAVSGEPVSTLADFYRSVWALGPATTLIPLTLDREGDVFEVVVRSGDRSRPKPRRLN